MTRPNSIEVEDNNYVIHLRKNIKQLDDGTWTYDEITFKHANPSLEWLGKNFNTLYEKHRKLQMTDSDRIKELQEQNELYRQALLELGTLVGEMKGE
jgi:hypothetical protein